MELHIKEFEYQNIIKQQMYKQLIVLILCMFLSAFAIESIGYNFKIFVLYFIYYLNFFITVCIKNGKKKEESIRL